MDRPYQPSWLETTSTEQKEWSEKDLKKLKDLVLFGDIPPSDPHYWSLVYSFSFLDVYRLVNVLAILAKSVTINGSKPLIHSVFCSSFNNEIDSISTNSTTKTSVKPFTVFYSLLLHLYCIEIGNKRNCEAIETNSSVMY